MDVFMVMITLMIIAMKIKTVIVVATKRKMKLKMTIEDYQEYMRYEEEVLAEEMERQRIANYDFERGDVKY